MKLAHWPDPPRWLVCGRRVRWRSRTGCQVSGSATLPLRLCSSSLRAPPLPPLLAGGRCSACGSGLVPPAQS
eukprot:6267334-Pyramimonas_sp.AAC.1